MCDDDSDESDDSFWDSYLDPWDPKDPNDPNKLPTNRWHGLGDWKFRPRSDTRWEVSLVWSAGVSALVVDAEVRARAVEGSSGETNLSKVIADICGSHVTVHLQYRHGVSLWTVESLAAWSCLHGPLLTADGTGFSLKSILTPPGLLMTGEHLHSCVVLDNLPPGSLPTGVELYVVIHSVDAFQGPDSHPECRPRMHKHMVHHMVPTLTLAAACRMSSETTTPMLTTHNLVFDMIKPVPTAVSVSALVFDFAHPTRAPHGLVLHTKMDGGHPSATGIDADAFERTPRGFVVHMGSRRTLPGSLLGCTLEWGEGVGVGDGEKESVGVKVFVLHNQVLRTGRYHQTKEIQ
jgi:hypothetical protein